MPSESIRKCKIKFFGIYAKGLEDRRQNDRSTEKGGYQKRNGEKFGCRCPPITAKQVNSGIWANSTIFVEWQSDFGQTLLEYSRFYSLL